MRDARTRVKVCGLTTAKDAFEAFRAGADMLGVVLADSQRRVSLTEAEGVFAAVPPFVARVGVFVDAEDAFVAEAVERLRLTAVQFHGAETPERCAAAPAPVLKAFPVGPDFDPGVLEPYREVVSAVLLDTFVPGQNGGTGKAFGWSLVPPLPGWARVVVAGGLNPVNVGAAIDALRPVAVDVCSGVEEVARHKDRARLHAFISAVQAADRPVA